MLQNSFATTVKNFLNVNLNTDSSNVASAKEKYVTPGAIVNILNVRNATPSILCQPFDYLIKLTFIYIIISLII